MNRSLTVLENAVDQRFNTNSSRKNLSSRKQIIIKIWEVTVFAKTDISKETKRYSKKRNRSNYKI